MASTQINGGTQIQSGTITNTQISASAAIATSKLQDGSLFLKSDGSVSMTADLNLNSRKVTNLAAPTNPNDAATKTYVDSISQGLDVKASVRAATTAALAANTYSNGAAGVGATLTANANGALAAQDGVTLIAGDRLLVKNEAAGANNGIYTVTQVGTGALPYILTRATDSDSSTSTPPRVSSGLFAFIEEGTTQSDQGWILTTINPITMGTTALTFTQFTGAGEITAGNGLTKAGNTLSVVAGNGIDGTFPGGAVVVKAADASLNVSASGVKITSGTSGQILVNSAGGIPTSVTMGGDATIVAAGTVSISGGITNHKITRETPGGTINGSNTAFTLANTPLSGTEELYLNGVQQDAGAGNDYTISGTAITMLAAPLSGDKLRVSYWK